MRSVMIGLTLARRGRGQQRELGQSLAIIWSAVMAPAFAGEDSGKGPIEWEMAPVISGEIAPLG